MTVAKLAKKLRRTAKFITDINILAGIPSRLNANNIREYRWSEIKKRLLRNRIMPPDDVHPYMEYTLEETAHIIGVIPVRVQKWMMAKKIQFHKKNMMAYFYRTDIEYFLRNYDREFLLGHLAGPITITDVSMLLGVSRACIKYKVKHGLMPIEPRKSKHSIKKISVETIAKYVQGAGDNKCRFRNAPMAEHMTKCVACCYAGLTVKQLDACVENGDIHLVDVPNSRGKVTKMYSKYDIDTFLLDNASRMAYCDGMLYYTRLAIEHKFGKTSRWIDEYIAGKCNRVDRYGHLAGADSVEAAGKKIFTLGWCREEVEHAVEENGDEHITMYMGRIDKAKIADEHAKEIARRKRLRRHNALAKERRAIKAREKQLYEKMHKNDVKPKAPPAPKPPKNDPKPPPAPVEPALFASPVDQIEAAIDASFAQLRYEHQDKRLAARIKAREERRTREAILNTLELKTGEKDPRCSKWTRLRFSESREIFTIVYNRNGAMKRGGSMKYTYYEHIGDEYIIHVSDRSAVSRRQTADTSIPILLAKGIEAMRKKTPSYLPLWIVMVPSTSYVPDVRFLDILRNVPTEYMAVAPFGYEYVMPDGSYDSCPKTYGLYSMYSVDSPWSQYVAGTTIGTIHEVQVMDGPFVAVRGEALDAMADLKMFVSMGECRAMMGPIVSAVCRKHHLKMGSIPVESVSCANYAIAPRSAEWNLIIDRINKYISG